MGSPTDNVVVFSLPPNNDPYKLYVGKGDQRVADMVHLWTAPGAPEFTPELVAEIEDHLFTKHNIVVVSPWESEEIEYRVAYYDHA
jgi:hypothetical protein